MGLAIFIFNIAQLLMMAGIFYYVIVAHKVEKGKENKPFKDDDDGGLYLDDLPDIVLPPVDGVVYPNYHIKSTDVEDKALV